MPERRNTKELNHANFQSDGQAYALRGAHRQQQTLGALVGGWRLVWAAGHQVRHVDDTSLVQASRDRSRCCLRELACREAGDQEYRQRFPEAA